MRHAIQSWALAWLRACGLGATQINTSAKSRDGQTDGRPHGKADRQQAFSRYAAMRAVTVRPTPSANCRTQWCTDFEWADFIPRYFSCGESARRGDWSKLQPILRDFRLMEGLEVCHFIETQLPFWHTVTGNTAISSYRYEACRGISWPSSFPTAHHVKMTSWAA